jgi:hypothetical protein
MKSLLSVAAIAIIAMAAGASADELPTYGLTEFPISPHQFSVLGSANVTERSPSASLMMAGMPASPHQVAVLTPRQKSIEEVAEANTVTTVSFSTR